VKKQAVFSWMSRNTDYEKPEVILAEMTLIDSLRITDTFEPHDTLTIVQSLVNDPKRFYDMGKSLVGSNFLKMPYE
jgi:hypothetical protein